MKKYRLTFDFFDTLEEGKKFIKNYIKRNGNKYLQNKNRNVKINNWTSEDQTEHKKIIWYYI